MPDYNSIDMNAIARWQHGSTAKALLEFDHAYGWKAIMPNGEKRGLDLQGWAQSIGSNFHIIQTSMRSSGWALINTQDSATDYTVQPVLIIPNSFTYQQQEIDNAEYRYRKNWEYAQAWLRAQLGKSIKLASKTQMVLVSESSQQLLTLARSTSESAAKRGDLLWYCRDKLRARYATKDRVIYVIATYTGNHPDEDFGSASVQQYNCLALSSDNTSLQVNPAMQDPKSRRIAFDTLHEFLHCLGLDHTDASHGPGWEHSIMMWGEPNDAIITAKDRLILGPCPYLKSTN